MAGEDMDASRDRIHCSPGPRRYPPGSPIRTVHGDASMYVGGLRALLLQSMHPLPMAAVADFSGYRSDPWGRLAGTAGFIASTTFGNAEESAASVDRIRRVHSHVRGTSPDGREYRADDPHLLRFVHVAEIDSFLRTHRAYGRHRLSAAQYDMYVAQAAPIAEELGATSPPTSVAELDRQLEHFRAELEVTAAARDVLRFLLVSAPVPLVARGPYTMLAMAAVESLPPWARTMFGLPTVPLLPTVSRAAGHVAIGALRWFLDAEAVVTADEG